MLLAASVAQIKAISSVPEHVVVLQPEHFKICRGILLRLPLTAELVKSQQQLLCRKNNAEALLTVTSRGLVSY